MSKEKIAIVVDSGCDIAPELRTEYDIHRLPLRIIIDGEEFADDTLSYQDVYDALEVKKVTTSLPSGKDIMETLESLEKEGFNKVIAITISSGISGTNNVLNNMKSEFPNLEIEVIDTLNVSLGSGVLALFARDLINEGKSFSEIIDILHAHVEKAKMFFTVDSIEYLQRGGRIGLVAGTVASMLNIKPIISCNEEGIYYTVAKVRSYRKSVNKMIELAKEFIGDHKNYKIYLVEANTKTDIQEIGERIKTEIPSVETLPIIKISAALGIHTGPEAMGIAVLLLD